MAEPKNFFSLLGRVTCTCSFRKGIETQPAAGMRGIVYKIFHYLKKIKELHKRQENPRENLNDIRDILFLKMKMEMKMYYDFRMI